MRLTIFWRVILAQSALIALIVVVGFYALTQLHQLASLTTGILHSDSASIKEAKRLLKLFLVQERSAEKYLLYRDKEFYSQFTQGSSAVLSALDKIATLVDTPSEYDLLAHLRELYSRYGAGLATALTPKSSWGRDKTEISERIIAGINDLIRWREEIADGKTALARDQATVAATTVRWLILGGILTAVLFAYFHARSMSRPLQKLARELLRVGQGEFQRSLVIRAPKEISELAQSFNHMAAMLTALDNMKADFIAHVSHELRTPLTGIQEGTALLMERIPGPLTPSQQEILAVVWSHSARLAHSIAAILDLSKMEAGMLEYLRAPSDLMTLLTRSVEVMQLVAQKKQLQVEVCCPAPLPFLALDEERMQEVFDNLLHNAVKFTPEGGAIRVSATVQSNEQRSWVEVRVTDTGKGIPAEDVTRIFDKFYQSAYHQQDGHQGTGLGLTIARHIVEAHGGQIWAESQLGAGATFIFTLPVESHGPYADLTRAPMQQNGGWSAA